MSRYTPQPLHFNARRLSGGDYVVVSESGDHTVMSAGDLELLRSAPQTLSHQRQADLKALFLLTSAQEQPAMDLLLRSRIAARKATVIGGPSLHIVVPTLQCAHTCKYCQVSRSLSDVGFTMSEVDLDAACESILESESASLTVEFQGGDPLLRFDLVRRAILRIEGLSSAGRRKLRFVVASTLHQLNESMCAFFREHSVLLSTSIDGPAHLHNRNRPLPTRDSYERTTAGIALARQLLGEHSVSALMTTSRASLNFPREVVDTYVRLGLHDIFLRPLSAYGFAAKNSGERYSLRDFMLFYETAVDRVKEWNLRGVPLREFYGSIILNKLLSPFDLGFVDLQSPTGAGRSVLVYNYDGYVYPSDEARMLAESGDTSFRLGRIGTPLRELRDSCVLEEIGRAGGVDTNQTCRQCAYSAYCAPNPVDAQAQFGSMHVDPAVTEHCARYKALFDFWVTRLGQASDEELDLYHDWANPQAEELCDV